MIEIIRKGNRAVLFYDCVDILRSYHTSYRKLQNESDPSIKTVRKQYS